jgi:hypothetical protein
VCVPPEQHLRLHRSTTILFTRYFCGEREDR